MSLATEAEASLERMQTFDVATLPRREELGESFDFDDAVPYAERLIELYARLSLLALQDLPDSQLSTVKSQADADFQKLSQILSFDPTAGNPAQAHASHIQQIEAAYQPAFNALHPLISYSLHRSADFQNLDRDARAALQSIQDQAGQLTKDLEDKQAAAESVLRQIREVAAEQGVTQQAEYFKKAADDHEASAQSWFKQTTNIAIGLGAYAVASLFLHRIPGLNGETVYATAQLAVSKVLIFTVISYMLYLAARNFIANKHNATVERHRQNALLTYRALVEAAGDTPNQELILVQAASCIFAPQPSGFGRDAAGTAPGATSLVELVSKQTLGGPSD